MDALTEKNAKDMSVPIGKVQLLVLPFIFVTLLLMIPYPMIWGLEAFSNSWIGFFNTWWFIPIILAGILAHELIHAFTWQQLARLRWSEMKLGFQWNTLTPYAHAKKPMKINPYRWGALMPAVVLGFSPTQLL
ncbi:MAG: DUF3267 domain-containing protein [Cyclobacteriaceae bacterium]